eukprot:jgi/Botrbrau1/6681/Bobra.0202s0022.2
MFIMSEEGPAFDVKMDISKYDFQEIYQRNKPRAKNIKELCRTFLLSEEFRLGTQTMFGQLCLALLVFVRPLYVSLACLVLIPFYISGIVRQTPHLGSYLRSTATIVSSFIVGVTLGGVVVVAHLYLLAAATGIVLLLSGGLVFPTLATDATYQTLAEAAQGLGHSFSGYASVVFLKEGSQHGLLHGSNGMQVNDGTEVQREDSRRRLIQRLEAHEQELQGLDYRAFLEHTTHPSRLKDILLGPSYAGVTPVSAYRPILIKARALLQQASVEPPWLSHRRFNVNDWTAVANALAILMTRTAALGSVIHGTESLLHAEELRHFLRDETVPTFRVLYAQLAASSAAIAVALRGDTRSLQGEPRVRLAPSWALLEFQLAAAVSSSLKAYWMGQDLKLNDLDLLRPVPQIRVLLYVAVLTYGIMEAMAELERAVVTAVGNVQHVTQHTGHQLKQSFLRGTLLSLLQNEARLYAVQAEDAVVARTVSDVEASRNLHESFSAAQRTRPSSLIVQPSTTLEKLQNRRGLRSSTHHESQQMTPLRSSKPSNGELVTDQLPSGHYDSLQQHVSVGPILNSKPMGRTTSSGKEKSLSTVSFQLSWTKGIIESFLWLDAFKAFHEVAISAWEYTRSPATLFSLLRHSRLLHFFLKFYISMTAALVLCLALSANSNKAQSWHLLYAAITVCVVMSEKMDVAVSKGLFRILSTIIGGTLGYFLMLNHDLATNPYALSALLGVCAFVAGTLTGKPYKYAVILTMITMNSIVLCQYNPEGKGTGSVHLYIVRIVDICVAVAAVFLIEFILPWYTSTAALESLGTMYLDAAKLLSQYYTVYHDELQLAACGKSAEEEIKGIEALERISLDGKVAKPLADLQVSIQRDSVTWRTGVLVLPTIVNDMMKCMQGLVDALAAVELALMQRPRISGKFSPSPYHNIVEPLHKRFSAVMEGVVELAQAVSDGLHGEANEAALDRISQSIKNLQEDRVTLRHHYVLTMDTYRGRAIRGDAPFAKQRTPDDTIRLQSCIFAFITAMDKSMLLARTLVQDEWLQKYSSASVSRQARLWLSRHG